MVESNWFSKFTLKNVVIASVGSFFLIQIASMLINQMFPSVPLLKGGNALLLILVAVAVISIFVLSMKLDELSKLDKANMVFMIVILGLVIAGFYYLPKYFPQLFVLSPDVTQGVKSTIASIFGVGG